VSSLTVTCIRKHCQRQFYVVSLLARSHVSRVATDSGSAAAVGSYSTNIAVKLSVRTVQCAASYRQRIFLSAAACTDTALVSLLPDFVLQQH